MAQELGKIPPTVPVYNKWEIDAELAKKVDTVNNVAPVKGNVDLSPVISNAITAALRSLATNGFAYNLKLYTLSEQALDNVQTLARAAGVQNISDSTEFGDIQTGLDLKDTATIQDAVDKVSN